MGRLGALSAAGLTAVVGAVAPFVVLVLPFICLNGLGVLLGGGFGLTLLLSGGLLLAGLALGPALPLAGAVLPAPAAAVPLLLALGGLGLVGAVAQIALQHLAQVSGALRAATGADALPMLGAKLLQLRLGGRLIALGALALAAADHPDLQIGRAHV